MIRIVYIIILIYFLLGGLGFYFINRKKNPDVARKSYTKFVTYFFIINILFFSIVINPIVFQFLSIVIIGIGFFEMFQLFQKSGYQKKWFYLISTTVFIFLSIGFISFSRLEKELILFSFIVLSIFDSFSQITGQLWGQRKLFPNISPQKTAGGFSGGGMVAIVSAFLLSSLYSGSELKLIIITFGVILFALSGDLAASLFKRKFGVKDYSNLIPGHGGFLDRFDSLIAAGAWVALCVNVFNF